MMVDSPGMIDSPVSTADEAYGMVRGSDVMGKDKAMDR